VESGLEEEDEDDDVRQSWMKDTVKDKALANKHCSGKETIRDGGRCV